MTNSAAGYPFPPEVPGVPGTPSTPRWPGHPAPPPGTPLPPRYPPHPRSPSPRPRQEPSPLVTPGRAWIDSGDWQSRLNERLLEQRVVMAHGHLDDTAATVLCAQLLTLDAESTDRTAPIRLHMQGLSADLAAALTVMDALDAVGVPVHAIARGHLSGPALGVLAAAGRRVGYPNSGFLLAEPEAAFEGTSADLVSRQRQFETMLDALYFRLADVTCREVDEIRDDARRGRFLTADEAVAYGLLQEVAQASRGS
ncbi:MAG TPA: ATP-dependent Clp protease proteolytic subunit [Streptosporangiaceae bacterium]|nr:ATP-dependent Clp protease proteolytic subunit [Streptosporangiaceae bacterium]